MLLSHTNRSLFATAFTCPIAIGAVVTLCQDEDSSLGGQACTESVCVIDKLLGNKTGF